MRGFACGRWICPRCFSLYVIIVCCAKQTEKAIWVHHILITSSPPRRYNTEKGVYAPGCGIDRLMFAWGHDEYMYRMLVANGTTIPKEGLAMVRMHGLNLFRRNQTLFPHTFETRTSNRSATTPPTPGTTRASTSASWPRATRRCCAGSRSSTSSTSTPR